MRRFHGDTSDDPRWLWEPAVHHAYGERCYFYLVSGRDPERRSTFTDELDALLDQINIESRLVHVVFGQYDAIVRIWATEHARQRFLRTLKKGRLEIYSFVEFAADEVLYDFNRERRTFADDFTMPDEVRSAVEAVVRAEHEASWDDTAESAFERLKSEQLIFKVPPAHGVKAYVFLSTAGAALAQPRDRILQALSESAKGAGLSQLSVYSGVGFSDFILKGWCPDFDSVLPSVNRIRRLAKDLRLTPWTLLAADGSTRRSGETIDAVQAELPTVLEEFLRNATFLGEVLPALRRELASLSDKDQDRIVSLYRDARLLLHPADLERYIEILSASLLRDRKLFNRSLSFLTSIEEDLRFIVPKVLARQLGKQWPVEARQRGWWPSPGAEPEDDLEDDKKLSLAVLLGLLAAASQEIPEVREEVQRFPSDWRNRIRDLLRLRNVFAHGSLWDLARSRDFAGEWGERLPVVATSIGLQAALEVWAEKVMTN